MLVKDEIGSKLFILKHPLKFNFVIFVKDDKKDSPVILKQVLLRSNDIKFVKDEIGDKDVIL
jgi:hypothetical protein